MKKFVAWDSEKRLSFAVPFADMKPVIYLDPFLPRISELALSTSDRQTKVGHSSVCLKGVPPDAAVEIDYQCPAIAFVSGAGRSL